MMYERQATDTIVIHHSASNARTTRDQIRHWHTDPEPTGRGWDDIGYHWLVFADGHVEPGRPEDMVGCHASPFNNQSIGVCLVGWFDDQAEPPEMPPETQWQAALQLVTALCKKYGVDPQRVFGHREVKATACPGFEPALFRAALADAVYSVPVPVPVTTTNTVHIPAPVL